MLHSENPEVRRLLLNGNIGLEKESLRVNEEGFLAQTPHPFSKEDHITRDFCENQVEINTPVAHSPQEAVAFLDFYYKKIQKKLAEQAPLEYLWPFSNPAFIRKEEDIPIALFSGDQASKGEYRQYLSNRYGRYKMTFCGIHFNYSFGEDLLQANFALSGKEDYQEYKNEFYIDLAQGAAEYGWILTAVTAASPLLDSSFIEKGRFGDDAFHGMASMRASELGYWNSFSPIFNYTNLSTYIDSIQEYVTQGLLAFPTELYYPIRLKPRGKNLLETLREQGVDHIELRMIDLNPLVPVGIDIRDVIFAQLLLVWLACTPREALSIQDQVQAVQNFKNAAHYDLKTVNIVNRLGKAVPVADAALDVLDQMMAFFQDFSEEILQVLAFQRTKFENAENRYAWQIREQYKEGFVKKGLELAKKRQQEALEEADNV